MNPPNFRSSAPDLTQQALVKAGVMADLALILVGGQGLNGYITPVRPDRYSEYAERLRLAAEEYNAHIISLAGPRR